jgi:S1-C subfamily serine protease
MNAEMNTTIGDKSDSRAGYRAGLMCALVMMVAMLGMIVASAKADHGPQTWDAANRSVVVVEPTWPGFARPGFGAPPGVAPAGTGVVYPIGQMATAPGSYILTAAHVVVKAERIEVTDSSGVRLEARLHGLDLARDIAVLHVEASLEPVVLAEVQALVGMHVCALVNAFGLGTSFTCGVVSAVQLQNLGFNEIEDFIQTDAAVNPGASGGALVLADGTFVGMLDGIFTKEADIDAGVNFAVSLDLIKESLAAMQAAGIRF